MARQKTDQCSICHEPMWTTNGAAAADARICRSCRTTQAHRAAAARQAPVLRCCGDCGQVWSAPRRSRSLRCVDCQRSSCETCGERYGPARRERRFCSKSCAGKGQPRQPGQVKPWAWAVHFLICNYCTEVYAARSKAHLHRAEPCRLAHQRAACARFVREWSEATGNVTAWGVREYSLTFEERLHSRYVVLDNGCWQWIGTFNKNGYGQIGRHGRTVGAHVAVWEDRHGPVPTGLQLDHDCHNADLTCVVGPRCRHRGCVNPEHLTPRTPAENHPSVRQNHLASR